MADSLFYGSQIAPTLTGGNLSWGQTGGGDSGPGPFDYRNGSYTDQFGQSWNVSLDSAFGGEFNPYAPDLSGSYSLWRPAFGPSGPDSGKMVQFGATFDPATGAFTRTTDPRYTSRSSGIDPGMFAALGAGALVTAPMWAPALAGMAGGAGAAEALPVAAPGAAQMTELAPLAAGGTGGTSLVSLAAPTAADVGMMADVGMPAAGGVSTADVGMMADVGMGPFGAPKMDMSSLFGTLGNIGQIGGGLYGLYSANQMNKIAGGSDPWGKYRPEAAAMAANLMRDPSSLTKMPGYQAGLDAVMRSMSAQGYQGSGNMMAALDKYGGDMYMQYLQMLAGLGGAGVNPLGAGQLRMGAQQDATSSVLSSIFPILKGLGGLFGG